MLINGQINNSIYDIQEPPKALSSMNLLKKNQINNLRNEMEEIHEMNTRKEPIALDFIRTLDINTEEYNEALVNIEKYNNNFSPELYFDIISISSLTREQKAVLELFNYLINLHHYLNWVFFKNHSSYTDILKKMIHINYNVLSVKNINHLLDRLCPNCCFPEHVSNSLALTYLLKWIGYQITVFAYLNNHNLLKKEKVKEFVERISEGENNDSNAIFNSSNNLTINYKKKQPTSFNTKNSISNSFKQETMECDADKMNVEIMITKLKCENFNNNSLIDDKHINASETLENHKRFNSRYNYDALSSKGSNRNKSVNVNSLNNSIIKQRLINKNLALNGYNIIEDKIKNEQKVLNYIPLIDLRTFPQLRQHFQDADYMKKMRKIRRKFESQNYDDIQDLKHSSKQEKKVIFKLCHNNGDVLNNYSREQMHQILNNI